MAGGIDIKEAADHLLILGAVLLRLTFKEINALPAQSESDLYVVFLEYKIFRGRSGQLFLFYNFKNMQFILENILIIILY